MKHRKISNSFIGLLALIALAAIMPSYVLAADVAHLATNPTALSLHCSDAAVGETNVYRDLGTSTSYWNSCEQQFAASNLELTASDRNYGTFAGFWSDEATSSDRMYGTFAGIWSDQAEAAGALNRAYGTFSGAWTGYLDNADSLNPELAVAGRYTAGRNDMPSGFLAANPELSAAHAYSVLAR
jgi:hypothetical protein